MPRTARQMVSGAAYHVASRFLDKRYRMVDDYNRVRPHSSLGNMTPSAFAITRGVQS